LILLAVSYQIGVKQKDYDKIFDPLKSYEIDMKFMALNGNVNITYKNIMRPESFGSNVTISKPERRDTAIAKKNNGDNYLFLDLVITNKSPYLIMLKPKKCATLIVEQSIKFNSSLKSPENTTIDLVTKDLDFNYLDSLEKANVQNSLMFFPGETQWLHLKGFVSPENYKKLSYIKVISDSLKIQYSYQVALNCEIVRNAKLERELRCRSDIFSLQIQDFVPDTLLGKEFGNALLNWR